MFSAEFQTLKVEKKRLFSHSELRSYSSGLQAPLFTHRGVLSSEIFVSQRIITLLTDFGSRDAFVGILKGVILGISPEVSLVDLSHEVPPQDIMAGALLLRSAAPYFPQGVIHVAVVDPGVGSNRRALLVETPSALFVGPDNGLLSLAASTECVTRLFHLTDEQYFLSPRSQTFHGRDVFAPVAAHLARGVRPEQCGDLVSSMERLELPPVHQQIDCLIGSIIYIDHFGNLVTNITEVELRPFPRESLLVSIGSVRIRGVVTSYATVQVGAPAALINSWGMLEIAVRNGSAAQRFQIHLGQQVQLTAT